MPNWDFPGRPSRSSKMKHELVGKTAQVAYNNRVIHGRIVDETKNMIHLETEGKIIKIIKKNAIITIGKQVIQGRDITKRPEERIKEC